MNDAPTGTSPPAEAARPRRTWIVALAIAAGLLMCTCVSTVLLVLTGIIAEPVTVIEEILRTIQALLDG